MKTFLPDAPPRRAVVLRLALPVVAVLALMGLFDWMAPSDRIVYRGRVFHCLLMGGTRSIDFDEEMRINPAYTVERLGWVDDLVAAEVSGPESGTAVFSYENDRPGAMNDLARRIAAKHSSRSMSGAKWEAGGAAECARRNLPR